MPRFASVLFVLLLFAGGAFAEEASGSGPGDIPRLPSGKPDLSGFWNIPYTPNLARDTPEDEIPYTDLGRRLFLEHDSKDDPTSLCWYPGVPRIMQSPYPVQFIQTDDYLVMAFEYDWLHRVIPIGQPHPENIVPTFLGDSVAHWEGDTLVVETIGLNDKTWLDTAGHQHSDQLKVIERFTRVNDDKGDRIIMNYDIIDPVMYKEPWNLERPLTPLKGGYGLPMLIEYACTENNKDVEHLRSFKPAEERLNDNQRVRPIQ